MTEDLSKMTFEERKTFFDEQLQNRQEESIKYAKEQLNRNNSFAGRLQGLFKSLKKEAKNSEKENALYEELTNADNWKKDKIEGRDGLFYGTNEFSVREKAPEDIIKMQHMLYTRWGIKTYSGEHNGEKFICGADPVSNQLIENSIQGMTETNSCNQYYIPLTKAEYQEKQQKERTVSVMVPRGKEER